MTVVLTLPCGAGEAVSLDAERFTFVSPMPYAPGQPVTLTVAVEAGSISVEGRSQSSKKRPDARFEVCMRLVNVSRKKREQLEAALGG